MYLSGFTIYLSTKIDFHALTRILYLAKYSWNKGVFLSYKPAVCYELCHLRNEGSDFVFT